MISLTVSGTDGITPVTPATPVTMLWRVEPGLKRNPEPEPGPEPTDDFLLFFWPQPDCGDCGDCWDSAGQKTKSLGTPSCPGLQETPEPTAWQSWPCSTTHFPVLLCSASTLGLYFTRQPRPPAQVPSALAKPPQVSPNWSLSFREWSGAIRKHQERYGLFHKGFFKTFHDPWKTHLSPEKGYGWVLPMFSNWTTLSEWWWSDIGMYYVRENTTHPWSTLQTHTTGVGLKLSWPAVVLEVLQVRALRAAVTLSQTGRTVGEDWETIQGLEEAGVNMIYLQLSQNFK